MDRVLRRVLVALLLLVSSEARAAVFHPQTFALSNGLQVVVVQNRLSPAVSQMVWYKVGSADEKPGHTGLAHYLEHLMFRGTEKIPAGAFSRILAEQGAESNAFTAYDYTAYYENVAADRLALVMQMEADRMRSLQITPETAATELKVVMSERQERTDNKPAGKFAERMRAALYPAHPYGIPVIGFQKDREKTTPEDTNDFYRAHYAPDNAVVVISGNVDLGDVMRLAAATYGRLPTGDRAPRRKLGFPGRITDNRVVMTDARVRQPRLEIHTLMPSYTLAKGNEAYALEVLNEVLDSGEIGVLYTALVERQKIASAIGISYDPQQRGPADFTIYAVPQPGRDVHALDKAINAELRKLLKKGVSDSQVRQAKERLGRAAVFVRDSLTAPGYVFGQALTTGQSVRDVEVWPERIHAVSTKAVNEALRRLVGSAYRVTGFLLPDAAAQTQEAAPGPEPITDTRINHEE